jgi:hypothetical protein
MKRRFRQCLAVNHICSSEGNFVLLVYVDDYIAICPENKPITMFMGSMQTEYVLTDEGNISAYLGIQVGCMKTCDGPARIPPNSTYSH